MEKLIDCPFNDMLDRDCVYYELGFCKDIENSPRNGDALCYIMIDKGIALEKLCQQFSEEA